MSVRVQDEGGKERGALGLRRLPTCHQVNVCLMLVYFYTPEHIPTLLQTSPFLVRRFTFTGECLCILALHGTHRVHDKDEIHGRRGPL